MKKALDKNFKIDSKGRVATSMKIDGKLWKRAKMEALRRDINVQVLVEEALQMELNNNSK